MNLTTHAKWLAICDANTKPAQPIDTVKPVETTILALQADINMLKSNQTPNPNNAEFLRSENDHITVF